MNRRMYLTQSLRLLRGETTTRNTARFLRINIDALSTFLDCGNCGVRTSSLVRRMYLLGRWKHLLLIPSGPGRADTPNRRHRCTGNLTTR